MWSCTLYLWNMFYNIYMVSLFFWCEASICSWGGPGSRRGPASQGTSCPARERAQVSSCPEHTARDIAEQHPFCRVGRGELKSRVSCAWYFVLSLISVFPFLSLSSLARSSFLVSLWTHLGASLYASSNKARESSRHDQFGTGTGTVYWWQIRT